MRDKTILLVEDNPDDELLTLRALKQGEILDQIIVVRDGGEALDFLFGIGVHEGRNTLCMPQVILLDLKLPKIDGLEVLRRIRADPRTQLLPVGILTSSKEEQDLIKGHSLGATSYICKPGDFAEFVEAVRKLRLYWRLLNEQPPSSGRPC